MSSGTLGLGPDISQEELDFSDLFLYPDNDFPDAKEDPAADALNANRPPTLVAHSPGAGDGISGCDPPATRQPFPSNSPTDHLSGPGLGLFDSLTQASRPGTIRAPSPRIEITPSGDSSNSQPLSSTALGDYREPCMQPCVSPASSNSSTGWQTETYSPLASPSVSPGGGAPSSAGWSAVDLCPGLQGIHTSSAHSSPGESPRTSITEETFLQPRHQRAASPHTQHHHQRSRSASPQGKRAFDQHCSPGLGGSPAKQRSRSPSPVPSPPRDDQGPCHLPHYQARAETLQLRASTPCMEEMPGGLRSSLVVAQTVTPKVVRSSEDGCLYERVQRQDCSLYGEGHAWRPEQDRGDGSGAEAKHEPLRSGAEAKHEPLRSGAEAKHEPLYILPTLWPQRHLAHHHHRAFSGVPPLPNLDWTLPSQSGQYELQLQQQPRSHHRAHYETEGSRGAIKTPNGGHPEVQLRGYRGSTPLALQVFIGTADERVLKPHTFYQVHRISSKTVTTPSTERIVNGTKVLEIPLEPKVYMRAVIDCAGILKLRNADIELRNGETDVGRKNTRVRMVFRVHIPEPEGQIVSLQVTSHPIECSQRSSKELPAVETQDLDRCSILGGQQMVLTGQNFTSDSKVIFCEKTHDGQQIWEVEATVDRDKSQSFCVRQTCPNIVVISEKASSKYGACRAGDRFATGHCTPCGEVPSYGDLGIYHPAKVNFYVINGKKKRSQPLHFTYTPLIAIKAEPVDDYQFSSFGCLAPQSHDPPPRTYYHHLDRDSHPRVINVSPTPNHLASLDPGTHGLVPHFPEDPSVYHSSRTSALCNSPVFYHAVNTHYNNIGSALLSGSPSQRFNAGLQPCHYPSLVSQLSAASVPSYSVSVGVPAPFESVYPATQRHQGYMQTAGALGKSPPSRYTVQDPGIAFTRADIGSRLLTQKAVVNDRHDDLNPDKVTVKQESHNHAYLEDVNDIIRRDLKVYSGERS